MVDQTLPVNGNGGHRVDAGKHGRDREEVVKLAVHLAKVPISVSRVNEIDERVEPCHGHIGERQVEKEVVCDGPHPLVRQDDPNHDQISKHRDHQHRAVSYRPERDAPRRLRELVGQISGFLLIGCHLSSSAACRRRGPLWHLGCAACAQEC